MVRLVILSFILHSMPATALARSAQAALNDKQVARAEKLLAEIKSLESLAVTRPDREGYEAVKGLSRRLLEKAAGLPEGDLRTDLLTALRFYDLAADARHRADFFGPRILPCERERPGAYQTLCKIVRGNRSELLWAKARLHTRWASVLISWYKGATDSSADAAVHEIWEEREFDAMLAERALQSLKSLERDVNSYKSQAEFVASGAVANIPLEEFAGRLRVVNDSVQQALAWLPEGGIKFELYKAMRSYLDGYFWWAKVYSPRVVRVSASGYAPPSPEEARVIDSGVAGYTAVINWRHAREYTRAAEELTSLMRRGPAMGRDSARGRRVHFVDAASLPAGQAKVDD